MVESRTTASVSAVSTGLRQSLQKNRVASATATAATIGAVPRLHVLTDTVLQSRFSHLELLRLASGAGAGVVQLREKRSVTTRYLIETAQSMLAELVAGHSGEPCVEPTSAHASERPAECLLVVDDRADVALCVQAHGVHLGREDLSPSVARKMLGPSVLIGGTANSLEEAVRVAALPVDYVGVGPVFGTRSKANPAPSLGVQQLSEIVAAVDKPVIAIGNITAESVAEVLDAGAHGVAVLGAIVCQPDPAAACHRFYEAIVSWLSRHPAHSRVDRFVQCGDAPAGGSAA